MKILVISALYPPYHTGGYELRCKNIMDALARRGHAILALTSRCGSAAQVPSAEAPYPIHRELRFNAGDGIIDRMVEDRRSHILGMLLAFVRELWFDCRDTGLVAKRVKQFRPDVVYLGHVTNFSKTLVPYLAEMPLVYDEGGSGLIHLWTEKGIWYKFVGEYSSRSPVANAIRPLVVGLVRLLSAGRLRPRWAWPDRMRILFNGELNSQNARAAGVPTDGAQVIRSGIDVGRFTFRPRSSMGSPLRIVVPGGFEPKKGQLDAVGLAAKLAKVGVEARTRLVGACRSSPYSREVRKAIVQGDLTGRVEVLPMVSPEELIEYYNEADICFFPSHHRTGFSRVPLEAMACGCIVISYGNEGSAEVIRNRHNGYLVQAADFEAIMAIIEELTSVPGRARDVAATARRDVEKEFSLAKYVDSIERLVSEVVDATPTQRRGLC